MPIDRTPVRLSAQAETDLEEILVYRVEPWDEAIADAYEAAIRGALDQLAMFPMSGQARDAMRGGYQSLRVRQHLIWYRIEDDGVRVNRILHVRRDAKREFGR